MLSRGKKEGLDPITGFSFCIKAFFSLLCATVSWSDLYFLEIKITNISMFLPYLTQNIFL